MENLKGQKLKFFIAYETRTGKDIAIHLKYFLEELKEIEEAFVAAEDISPGEENEEEYRFEKIKKADYFVLILTPKAWEISESLKKEFYVAKSVKKKNFILCVCMKGAEIPEEVKTIQWLRQEPFKNEEEVAREFGTKIKKIYEDRMHELLQIYEDRMHELLQESRKIKELKKRKLKFFIAYETDIGKDIAIHLKHFFKGLEEIEEAFVAAEDMPAGEENEEKYRFKKIKKADYFVLILTSEAWETSESLKKEFYVAKSVEKENFILCVCMKGAEIPEEVNTLQWLRQEPFESKEEVAKEFGTKIEELYKISMHELLKEKKGLKLMSESEFVKNIEEIINKNKRIYFYSPVAPISCLSERYMKEVIKLLDNAMKNDKNIFLLFSWKTTVEKINNLQKTKDKLLKDMNILLGKPYLKLIDPFGSILQTPSKDEGIVFGENSNEALIWWKPANEDIVYVMFEDSKEEIDVITELFNRNYNKELSFDTFSEFSKIFI